MKKIICLIILLLTFTTFTFAQSVLDYNSGTGVEIQTGADVCADNIIINGTFTGGGTICGATAYVLSLTAFIQGFYNPATNFMVSDTVKAYLRKTALPFVIVDSAKGVLSPSGIGTFIFSNAVNGISYYLVIKHRNSIETWSLSGMAFASGSLAYNFTTAANKAYGNNQIQVDLTPVRFAIFSTDVNQDGNVNLTDIILVYNAASVFTTGYKVTDVNGDNIVNLTDIVITYNNSAGFVGLMRP